MTSNTVTEEYRHYADIMHDSKLGHLVKSMSEGSCQRISDSNRSQRLHDRSQRLISFHWVTYRKAPNKKACLRLAVAHLSGPVPDENSTSYKKAEKTETTFEFDAPASGRQKTSQAAQPLVKVGGLCFYNNTNTRYRYL
jgi:hypothetical protein